VKSTGKAKRKTRVEIRYSSQPAQEDEKWLLKEEAHLFPAYRNLKVWGKAHDNLLDIINLLKAIPDNSVTGRIKDQIIGAASSVGANIAEGSGIYRGKRFVGHLEIAVDSACETDNWLQVLKDSRIGNVDFDKALLESIIQRNCEVIKMLLGLIQSIEKKRASAL